NCLHPYTSERAFEHGELEGRTRIHYQCLTESTSSHFGLCATGKHPQHHTQRQGAPLEKRQHVAPQPQLNFARPSVPLCCYTLCLAPSRIERCGQRHDESVRGQCRVTAERADAKRYVSQKDAVQPNGARNLAPLNLDPELREHLPK